MAEQDDAGTMLMTLGFMRRVAAALLLAGGLVPGAAVAQDGPPERWWMREGKGYVLCEAVYKELRKYTPEQAQPCMTGILLSVSGIKQIDGWKEIDPEKHAALFKGLLQYQAVGVDAYFGRNPQRYERRRWEPARLEQEYREFLGSGMSMRVRTVELFSHPLGHPELTQPSPQTVLEMRDRKHSDRCPSGLTQPDRLLTYYVAADLSGPSPDIPISEAASMGGGAQIVEYRNKLHLMRATTLGAEFYADLGEGMLKRFCEIQPR